MEERDCLIKEAEKAVLGIDHAEAGRLLAERWKLSPSVKNTVYFHHSGLNEGGRDDLIGCVHIADIAARMFSLGNPGDRLIPEPNAKVWSSLNLGENTFTEITPALMNDFNQTISHILDT